MLEGFPSELLVVGLVALIVIGPKDLPRALRFLGKWVGRARGIVRQFRSGFDEMIRESELAELQKQWAAENERIMRDFPGNNVALPAPHPVDATVGMPVDETGAVIYETPAAAAPAASDAPQAKAPRRRAPKPKPVEEAPKPAAPRKPRTRAKAKS